MSTEISERIQSTAAEWVARLDRPDATPADHARLGHWLAEDRRHRGAFVRAQAAWRLLDRGQVLAAGEGAFSNQGVRALPRRAMLLGTAAGLVGLAVGGGWMVTRSWTRGLKLETAFGEVRNVKLEDGSTVFLNTESAIEVAFKHSKRLVHLRRGEVWVDVAKDRSRPFVIYGDGLEVRAVGTAFSVGSNADHMTVLVTEGTVELSSATRVKPIRLASGARAIMQSNGRAKVEPVKSETADRLLAWREGRIGLDGETVQQAVQAFNRYNTTKLVVDDNRLAEERLVGWFDIKDPQGFAAALSISLGTSTEFEGQVIHLSFR